MERGDMRRLILVMLVLLLAGFAFGDDAETDSLIRLTVNDFMLALQSGDGAVSSGMFSSQAMGQVDVMLVSIKQNLDRDPEVTLRRLSSVGYSIELDEAESWETEDYLSATLSLPMIAARYALYELEISLVTADGRDAVVDMIFTTAAGVAIPQQAVMTYEDGDWKVTDFMGITAFP